MIREIYKKNIKDVYKTSIVQQTAYWSEVKRRLGLDTTAIDFKVRKSEISVESVNNYSINGMRAYDMFGVSPAPDSGHPLHGLYRFKAVH